MLLELPFELKELIFSFLLIEWFSIDARLLKNVLLDRSRIGSIKKERYEGKDIDGQHMYLMHLY